MSNIEIILGIVSIVISIVLVAIVLFQHGKVANLGGTISGTAETFFGKNKGRSIDAKLGLWTAIISVVFVILTVVLNIITLMGK
ncbi:MAG: preprotein translocase subunit SecG [Clostridia bacterium]